jgi:hypothetical protein
MLLEKLMSAEIINFIPKLPIDTFDYGYIHNQKVKKPKTSEDYLLLLKKFLDTDDYEETLLCIMDDEYYESADEAIRNIVDCYYNFPH